MAICKFRSLQLAAHSCALTSDQIVEGAATIGWAIISAFILPDFPANTKRLSDRERELAISRLEADSVTSRTEDATKLTSLQALMQSVRNWRTWLLVAGKYALDHTRFCDLFCHSLGYIRHKLTYTVWKDTWLLWAAPRSPTSIRRW